MARKAPPLEQSGTVYCLPSLRMNSPQQAGMSSWNTVGGAVNRASFRGYYHLSHHQPAGSGSCLSCPTPPTRQLSFPSSINGTPLLCSEKTASSLKPQQKAIWNLQAMGALRSLFGSDLGVLARSLASLTDESKPESCSFLIQCLAFPRRFLAVSLKPILS